MNRINPIHIAGLLVVVLLFLLMQLSSVKQELQESKELYEETFVLSTRLSSLHEIYSDKQKVQKSIHRILKQSSLKRVKIDKKVKTSGITLTGSGLTKLEINSLMGKIINGSYNIHALQIKKMDKNKISFMLEIRW